MNFERKYKSFNYKMLSYFIHKLEKELVSIYYVLNILYFHIVFHGNFANKIRWTISLP